MVTGSFAGRRVRILGAVATVLGVLTGTLLITVAAVAPLFR